MAITGSICVITGAGRGIGREAARLLSSHGASLALCSRSGSGLDELACELEETHGTAVLTGRVDVADAAAVARFADRVEQELGPAYAVVNNAAVLGPVGSVMDVDCGAWAATFHANVLGIVHTTKAFGAAMAVRGRGGVVVNLSGGGIGGPEILPRVSAYTASKAAVVALTESLGRELVDSGIRVNAIAPGALATDFTKEVVEVGPDVAGHDLYEATVRDREQPMSFDAFAGLLLYVLSDEADWLTGRLLSARWDTPEALAAGRDNIVDSSLLQLRRIDSALYLERALSPDAPRRMLH